MWTLFQDLIIRPANDTDADGLVALIEGCFDEYDGCVIDIDGIDKNLKAIKTYVVENDGEFWVVLDGEKIIGSVGYVGTGNGKIELVRMYIHKNYRRRGLASFLLNMIRNAAKERGAKIDLWSDTRFDAAHAFYERHGFVKQRETRDLNDPSNTTEYYFVEGA